MADNPFRRPPMTLSPKQAAEKRAAAEMAAHPTPPAEAVSQDPQASAPGDTDLDALMAELEDLQGRVEDTLAAVAATVGQADLDHTSTVMRRLKAIRERADKVYQVGRGRLWDLVGAKCGKFRTPTGQMVEFKRMGTTSRRVNYKTLETRFPEAYAAAVTVTTKDLDQPGNLYLR